MTEQPRRGPGRPRLDPAAPRPAVLYVRLPPAVAAELRRVVPQREISETIRELVEAYLARLRQREWK